MSSQHESKMQMLFSQHMEALEKALLLGRQYEQALASYNTSPPLSSTGSPARQAQPWGRQHEQTLGSYTTQPATQLASSASLRSLSPGGDDEDRNFGSISSQPSLHSSLTAALHGAQKRSRSQALSGMPEDENLHEPLLTPGPILQRTRPDHQYRQYTTGSTETPISANELEVAAARCRENLELKVKKLTRHNTLSIVQKEEHVEKDLLKSTGFAQKVRRNRAFNFTCFAAVLGNAIWVSMSMDWDYRIGANEHPNLFPHATRSVRNAIDNAICGWFLLEAVVWFWAFKSTCKALGYSWFALHAIIVGLMVWSLWLEPLVGIARLISSRNVKNLSFLTVTRLTHLARAAHLFEEAPEMALYAKGVLKGVKSIAPLLTLFSLLVYVFAIAFRWLLVDIWSTSSHLDSFSSVPKIFHFLFLSAFASVDKNFFNAMLDAGWLPWLLFVAYTLIGNLTVAKMLTGVLLEVVKKLVQKEKEKTDTAFLEETIEKVARELDANGDGTVSKAEFQVLMQNDHLLESMAKHSVDVAAFIDFTLAYFPSDGTLYVSDLIRSAKQFCGFKPASVMDMHNMRKLIYLEMDVLLKGQNKIREELQALDDRLSDCQQSDCLPSSPKERKIMLL